MAHSLSCSREIHRRALIEHWRVEDTVDAILRCCGTRPLRAHRLARGWTLGEAIAELHKLGHLSNGGMPAVNEEQLRAWETSDRQPRPRTIDLLCRLYRTDAAGLGLVGDYRRPSAIRATVAPGAAPPSHQLGDSLDTVVDAARRAVERTLARTTVSATQLEVLDERVLDLRRSYVFTPPTEMLTALIHELEEIRGLSDERQPASVQVRLSEMTALGRVFGCDQWMALVRSLIQIIAPRRWRPAR
ncbi:hypothetical protein ACFYNO_37630 [Kitasatospora sp. NPDC006697]|uniref:hypothetical protein n=1 Tax=Kitasatospora sp. NPDC006697 TaxID=3364020 RepID=UPI0036C58CBF